MKVRKYNASVFFAILLFADEFSSTINICIYVVKWLMKMFEVSRQQEKARLALNHLYNIFINDIAD